MTKDELPNHVTETDDGYACKHCGSEVGEDGYSADSEPEEESEIGDEDDTPESPQGDELDRLFHKAVSSK